MDRQAGPTGQRRIGHPVYTKHHAWIWNDLGYPCLLPIVLFTTVKPPLDGCIRHCRVSYILAIVVSASPRISLLRSLTTTSFPRGQRLRPHSSKSGQRSSLCSSRASPRWFHGSANGPACSLWVELQTIAYIEGCHHCRRRNVYQNHEAGLRARPRLEGGPEIAVRTWPALCQCFYLFCG